MVLAFSEETLRYPHSFLIIVIHAISELVDENTLTIEDCFLEGERYSF